MPPFRPWQMVPLPAPTAPSGKSSPALWMACIRCSSLTARSQMSLRRLSLHSPTTGLMLRIGTPSSRQRRTMYSTSASCIRPTLRVLVRAMGVSSVPSS